MDNTEYKILLEEHSDQKNGYLWSLQEENKENTIKEFTPCEVCLSFTLKELLLANWLEVGTSFDDETSKNMEKSEESGVIHAALNLEGCTSFDPYNTDQKISMFGTNRSINRFYLRINITENPNEISKCIVKGSTSVYEESKDYSGSISIHLFLKPSQFNYISDLIKINRLKWLELDLDKPNGFYSSANSDFIKVLTNSKEHEVITPDNCKINPPRLDKSYFSIRAMRHDKIMGELEETDEPEEIDLEKDIKNNIQEEKQILESILIKLDSIEKHVGFPLWIILGGLVGFFVGPTLKEITAFIKAIFAHIFS